MNPNQITPMKAARLQEILDSARNGTATINEAVEIAGAALASSSRNNGEIKQMLIDITKNLKDMQEQIDFLYQHNSPIYAAILEDEIEEDSEINLDEESEDAQSED
jgi:hypothetical protein